MDYILVQNQQTVLLGPMGWRQRMFQNEVNDLVDEGYLSTRHQLPPTEQGYIDLGDGFEIFPIVSMTIPDHDPMYQYLSGPFWTYADGGASGAYIVGDADLGVYRTNLIQLLAAKRYDREIAGTSMQLQGQTVSLDTSRDGRNIFVFKYMLMADNDTVDWKFPEGWFTLTKAELGSVVAAGAAHIQAQFDWESSMTNQINSAADLSALKELAAIISPPADPAGPGIGRL